MDGWTGGGSWDKTVGKSGCGVRGGEGRYTGKVWAAGSNPVRGAIHLFLFFFSSRPPVFICDEIEIFFPGGKVLRFFFSIFSKVSYFVPVR